MTALICDPETLSVHGSRYKTMGAAKGALTRLRKSNPAKGATYVAMEWEDYNKLDIEIEVVSIMGGGKVKIRRSQVGGPCDPSTERYWSM